MIEKQTMSQEGDAERLIAWLQECAHYFENRNTGGEDAAHGANVFNAKTARKAADALASANAELDTARAEIETARANAHSIGTRLLNAERAIEEVLQERDTARAEITTLKGALYAEQQHRLLAEHERNKLARLRSAAPSDDLRAENARLREALAAMLDHSCVADSAPEDKLAEDHDAERKARAALTTPQPDARVCICGDWSGALVPNPECPVHIVQPDAGAQGEEDDVTACDECDWDCEQRFHSHAPQPSPEAAPHPDVKPRWSASDVWQAAARAHLFTGEAAPPSVAKTRLRERIAQQDEERGRLLTDSERLENLHKAITEIPRGSDEEEARELLAELDCWKHLYNSAKPIDDPDVHKIATELRAARQAGDRAGREQMREEAVAAVREAVWSPNAKEVAVRAIRALAPDTEK